MEDNKYLQGTTNSITIKVRSKKIYQLIEQLRTQEKRNVSFGDIILHAVCQNLKDFPEFNSLFEEITKKVIIRSNIDMGYSINLGKGPKTVVIKNAESKSLPNLSDEIKMLALKYIRDELSESDTEGSTFTITNLSPFNAYMLNTPVLSGQSAIISIASEYDSCQIVDNKVIPLREFNLSLSYDVRVSDCQRALLFLNEVKKMLERNN